MADCQFRETSRFGLYIMVFLILISTGFCSGQDTSTLNRKLDQIKAMQPCSQGAQR